MEYYTAEISSAACFIFLSAPFNFLSVLFDHTFLFSLCELWRRCTLFSISRFLNLHRSAFKTSLALCLSLSLRTTPLCAWDYELIISHLDSMLCVCAIVSLQDVMLWIIPNLDEMTGIQWDIRQTLRNRLPERDSHTKSHTKSVYTCYMYYFMLISTSEALKVGSAK